MKKLKTVQKIPSLWEGNNQSMIKLGYNVPQMFRMTEIISISRESFQVQNIKVTGCTEFWKYESYMHNVFYQKIFCKLGKPQNVFSALGSCVCALREMRKFAFNFSCALFANGRLRHEPGPIPA